MVTEITIRNYLNFCISSDYDSVAGCFGLLEVICPLDGIKGCRFVRDNFSDLAACLREGGL